MVRMGMEGREGYLSRPGFFLSSDEASSIPWLSSVSAYYALRPFPGTRRGLGITRTRHKP